MRGRGGVTPPSIATPLFILVFLQILETHFLINIKNYNNKKTYEVYHYLKAREIETQKTKIIDEKMAVQAEHVDVSAVL